VPGSGDKMARTPPPQPRPAMRLPPPTARYAALLLITASAVVAQPRAAEPLERRLIAEGPTALAKAARETGDPQRGAALFYQPQLSCTKCHACGGKDGESPLGPDLARPEPGTTAEAVVESLLAPSK